MAKQTFPVPGLVPIVSPSGQAKQPRALTMEQLETMEEVRFIDQILDPLDYNSQLLGIQSYLQTATNRGQNPTLVGLSDFDCAIITTKDDGMNPGFVSAGPYLVAQDRKTLKYGQYALIPPSGVSQDNFNYTTALALVGLATPDASAPVAG